MSKKQFEQEQQRVLSQINPNEIENLSKSDLAECGDTLASVYEGRELLGYVVLKSRLTIIERAMEKVKGIALEEIRKYKGEGKSIAGATVRHTEGGRLYDFSNDETWNKLKEQVKEREDFLKGLKTEMADTQTGEVSCPPMIKYKSDAINISFK